MIAERMRRLGMETAFEVLARALERQGKSIVLLEIGEPDFDLSRQAVEPDVRRAVAGGPVAVELGLPGLRGARLLCHAGAAEGRCR